MFVKNTKIKKIKICYFKVTKLYYPGKIEKVVNSVKNCGKSKNEINKRVLEKALDIILVHPDPTEKTNIIRKKYPTINIELWRKVRKKRPFLLTSMNNGKDVGMYSYTSKSSLRRGAVKCIEVPKLFSGDKPQYINPECVLVENTSVDKFLFIIEGIKLEEDVKLNKASEAYNEIVKTVMIKDSWSVIDTKDIDNISWKVYSKKDFLEVSDSKIYNEEIEKIVKEFSNTKY